MSSVEFDYEYEIEDQTVTWTVDLSYHTYKDRKYGADADGNRGTDAVFFEPDEMTILDQHLEDITFYVRASCPELYKRIYSMAEEKACEQPEHNGYDNDDAWKGYD